MGGRYSDSERHSTVPFSSQAKSSLKLVVILFSYSLVFITMVRFGFWTYEVRETSKEAFSVWDCFTNDQGKQCNMKSILTLALFNTGLIVLFGLQHSLMSQRKLIATKYWELVHYVWEIDKAIYNIFTALTLLAIMTFWQPIDLTVWKIESISNAPYTFHFTFHVLAWGVFYGTNLMIDFPDLIGLNQVIIECPTKVAKSPELQTMIENQRHMGLLPLFIVLLVHPYMSLDRLLLTLTMLVYTYVSWRSHSCYPYAKNMRRVKHDTVYNHYD